jgi:hypothetical protein
MEAFIIAGFAGLVAGGASLMIRRKVATLSTSAIA